MTALVVLHEASRTGAPRVGGLIASALQRYFDVRVVCLNDGPLIGWLKERVGAENVTVIDYQNARHRTPFGDRIRTAREVVDATPYEFVYVNSTAASEFVIGSKLAGRKTILNVHEKASELRRLLQIDLAKIEVLSYCDGIVLAANDLRIDLADVFGFVPERCLSFGIAVDAREIETLAQDTDAPARNAAGDLIDWGKRLAIGMCGQASPRKGCDMFFEVAAALPEHDFVWIGGWTREEAPENIILDAFARQKLPNLYVSHGVDNPYKYIGRLDLFYLSSREDPNPLVLAEALLLGVPLFCFSKTTAVTDFLGRNAIMCHGATNVGDSVRVLCALDPAEIRSAEFRRLTENSRSRFDISQKIASLVEFIAGT